MRTVFITYGNFTMNQAERRTLYLHITNVHILSGIIISIL